jgi:hypothetical protein
VPNQELLHLVELLNYLALIEVRLDFFVRGDVVDQHGLDEGLEFLPKLEAVVTLSHYEVNGQNLVSLCLVECLEGTLELVSDFLVDIEHLEHKLFDLLDF